MVSYSPDWSGPQPGPDEVAQRVASYLQENSQHSEEIAERIRDSDTPLTEPAGYPASSHGSIQSAIRYTVLTKLKQEDEIGGISFSKTSDDREVSITTHPSRLDKTNRLLHPASLAKLYQYGYHLNSWSTQQGGSDPKSVDSKAGVPWGRLRLSLSTEVPSQEEYDSDNHWFNDEEAVTEFAARVTDDNIEWAEYIPWYRTTTIPTYRLVQAAQTTDWSELPDHPDSRPELTDRFSTATNPRVGDFIRMAVLQKLEQMHPSIVDLSTGPDPWTTDRVSMVIRPTADGPGLNDSGLCPPVVLKKLADYGYRPTDGWYDAPAIGYEPDDPIVPRRLEFARGQALQTWHDEVQSRSPLFEDVDTVREIGFLPGIGWQTLVSCVRSQIILYQQLYQLDQAHNETF